MMASAQVVETSVNVTSNSPSQDYTHPDDHNLPNYDMTPGFKPFTDYKKPEAPRHDSQNKESKQLFHGEAIYLFHAILHYHLILIILQVKLL